MEQGTEQIIEWHEEFNLDCGRDSAAAGRGGRGGRDCFAWEPRVVITKPLRQQVLPSHLGKSDGVEWVPEGTEDCGNSEFFDGVDSCGAGFVLRCMGMGRCGGTLSMGREGVWLLAVVDA